MSTTLPPLDSIPVTATVMAVTATPTAYRVAPPLPPPVMIQAGAAWPTHSNALEGAIQPRAVVIEGPSDEMNPFNTTVTTGTLYRADTETLRSLTDNGDISLLPHPVTALPRTSAARLDDRSLHTETVESVEPVGSTPEMSLGLSSSPSSNVNESSSSSNVANPQAGIVLTPQEIGFFPYPEYFEMPESILKKIRKKTPPSYETLSKKKDYYIVPWLGKFHYYKIKPVKEVNDFLYRIPVKPDTTKEGLVVIGKDVYYVTFKDLIRGIIRKSRKVEIKSGTTYAELLEYGNPRKTAKRTGASNTVQTAQSQSENPVPVNNDARTVSEFGMDVIQSANLASEIQKRALLATIFEEEEWIDSEDF